jgi:hypothetical protein
MTSKVLGIINKAISDLLPSLSKKTESPAKKELINGLNPDVLNY